MALEKYTTALTPDICWRKNKPVPMVTAFRLAGANNSAVDTFFSSLSSLSSPPPLGSGAPHSAVSAAAASATFP